ncbi:Oidioi.mRNA.OKI2018_I69.chr2.g5893.t1.cds [Oikopleura dioica]|uniref:Oidioi.mRNA.OKI2018_I69.chr2.g5893.t1.cds n=1 Tax=Oikopleura dioica TaxID=34765 RepID=A0ABN7T8B2_OIKDI|nr:Oidioi.mRNA.OKI2018_I69.chr2.g5893.t1.cds [Oikopleura dioica]
MVEGLIDTGQQSSLRAAFGATSTATFPQFAVSSNMEQQFYGSSIAGQRISENEQKIIAQAEFYLSEDYLTKNAYLLRQVARKRNGFLSVKFISSFKRMRELTPDWATTAKALSKSNKLELSADGMKVRRRQPLTAFISSIKAIRSVLITAEELSLSMITNLLIPYGEIVFIQVIKPGMEIPDNIRPYCARHPELGSRPVAVVKFDTAEAAHRCCRELDSHEEDGELRVCLLGTRIRSFARHRRKKEKSCFGEEFENSKTAKDRLSPSDASVDSAISDVSSSQEGSLNRQPTCQRAEWSHQLPRYNTLQSNPAAAVHRQQVSPAHVPIDRIALAQAQIYMQEKLLFTARLHYQNALMTARSKMRSNEMFSRAAGNQNQAPTASQYGAATPGYQVYQNCRKSSESEWSPPPPPGLEAESEAEHSLQANQQIQSWIGKLALH